MDDLYGDLPPTIKKDVTSTLDKKGWDTNVRIIKPQIIKTKIVEKAMDKPPIAATTTIEKKPPAASSITMVPSTIKRKMMTPSSAVKKKSVDPKATPVVVPSKEEEERPKTSSSSSTTTTVVIDEYDPFHPNDYGDYCLEREALETKRNLLKRQKLHDMEREKEIQQVQQNLLQGKRVALPASSERGLSTMPAWMKQQLQK